MKIFDRPEPLISGVEAFTQLGAYNERFAGSIDADPGRAMDQIGSVSLHFSGLIAPPPDRLPEGWGVSEGGAVLPPKDVGDIETYSTVGAMDAKARAQERTYRIVRPAGTRVIWYSTT